MGRNGVRVISFRCLNLGHLQVASGAEMVSEKFGRAMMKELNSRCSFSNAYKWYFSRKIEAVCLMKTTSNHVVCDSIMIRYGYSPLTLI
jgi:hypothetical protein